MPVRYVPDPELARLSTWPGEIADEDAVTFFTLRRRPGVGAALAVTRTASASRLSCAHRTTRSAWNWSLPAIRFTPKFQSMTVIAQPEPGSSRTVTRRRGSCRPQHLDWRVHQC